MSSQHPLPGGAQDVFQPVGGAIPNQIPARGDHPVHTTGVVCGNQSSMEIRTNHGLDLGQPYVPDRD